MENKVETQTTTQESIPRQAMLPVDNIPTGCFMISGIKNSN